jgi:hypothetical protein
MIILGLDDKTKVSMKELFGDKVCCDCGKPAERLFIRRGGNVKGRGGDYFYCHQCYGNLKIIPLEMTEKQLFLPPQFIGINKVRISDV